MAKIDGLTITAEPWIKQTRVTKCAVDECRFYDEGNCQLKHIELSSNGQCVECDQ